MTILSEQRIILTGATGGIGFELTKLLLAQGGRVGVVGRCSDKLDKMANMLNNNKNLCTITADITTENGRDKVIERMQKQYNGYDMLINNAGTMDFTSFIEQNDERIEATFKANVMAPMLLCKKVIPYMRSKREGHLVNIGSIFGSIGFAWFTTYSSSKFALRGFSQALRRELDGTGIKVSYIAPRAVKTSLNSKAVYNMAREVKMNMDDPEIVAKQIIRSIVRSQKDTYLGFPESIFVRINAIFPGIVDLATRSQNKIAKKHV